MAESDIKVTQTLDDSQMIKELLKQQSIIVRTKQKLGEMTKAAKKGGDDMGSSFGRATGELKNLAGAITGIGSVTAGMMAVVRQVQTEIENIKSREKDAASAQLDAAKAQRSALFNFSPDASLDRKTFRERIALISSETGASEAGLYQAASTALSFKGAGLSNAEALQAVAVAARIEPGDPGAITTISQGILAQQKRTGGTAFQIAGFQQAVKQISPVASNQEFAQNVAPAIANLKDFGDDAKAAGALLATLGQGGGDPTGQVSATAAVDFARQLELAMPKVAGGTIGRLKYLQTPAGAKIRKRLLGAMDVESEQAKGTPGLHGRAKMFSTMRGLVSGADTDQSRLLEQNLAALPELGSESSAVLRGLIDAVNSETLQRTAALQRTVKSGAERIKLGDTAGGRRSISREGLGELMKAGGSSALEQSFESLKFEHGDVAPIDSVVTQLEKMAGHKMAGNVPTPGQRIEFGPNAGRLETEAFPERAAYQQAQLLREIADQLKQMNQREAAPKPVKVVNPPPQIPKERPAKAVERKAG